MPGRVDAGSNGAKPMAVYTDVADDELRAFVAVYDIGENKQEFIAACAGHRICAAQRCLQLTRHMAQELVTGTMPQ